MKYKILSHTADLRLEVYGTSLEELFKNAAEAMAEILYPRFKTTNASESTKEIIKVESANLNILLVDFLNEILARSSINKCVYRVKGLGLRGETKLNAELVGQKVEEFEEDIKAVTYHEVNIQKMKNEKRKMKNGEIWKTKLVIDI